VGSVMWFQSSCPIHYTRGPSSNGPNVIELLSIKDNDLKCHVDIPYNKYINNK
jgi:hypothetical protein